jgi:hypothetical protein
MGSKRGYLIIIILLASIRMMSQSKLEFSTVDSLTYGYYLNGSWDNLIKMGNEALDNNIDFKFLRQRIGYAYYSKENYAASARQFRKALSFDSYDSFTLEYLYYSYLYQGYDDAAAIIGGKMRREERKSLGINLFKPVESVSSEYNFKYAGTSLRTNPQYVNLGVSSRFGSRISLFQMISQYKQIVTIQLPLRDMYVTDEQFEYYALVKLNLARNLQAKAAYHYLNSTFSISNISSNLGYFGLTTISSRFLLGMDASVRSAESGTITQYGLNAGVNELGRNKVYLTGYLALLDEQNSARVIYTQRAGIRAGRKTWLEVNAMLGNLNNFSDYSAMYILNSIDPTTFRAGTSLYFYSGKHFSFWLNFAYERKQFYEDLNYDYNQFSYLGGIRWKI